MPFLSIVLHKLMKTLFGMHFLQFVVVVVLELLPVYCNLLP